MPSSQTPSSSVTLNLAQLIISVAAIILSIVFYMDNKIDSLNSKLNNKIDNGNQEIRNLINSSIRDYNSRIDSTNTRIDQVYRAPAIDPS